MKLAAKNIEKVKKILASELGIKLGVIYPTDLNNLDDCLSISVDIFLLEKIGYNYKRKREHLN